MGDLAQVSIVPGEVAGRAAAIVHVVTDHPVHACLASQYAGWALKDGKFFAMGSGPMRAAAGTEAIYDTIGFRETADAVVGVLETRKPPTPAIVATIASACRVEPAQSRFWPPPRPAWRAAFRSWPARSRRPCTSSPSSKFDLVADRVGPRIRPRCRRSPPTISPRSAGPTTRSSTERAWSSRSPGDDASLESIGPQVPSSSSRDYGEPFAAIFARYNNDFYAVDPHLFSPAEVVFQNVETGKMHAFGEVSIRRCWRDRLRTVNRC